MLSKLSPYDKAIIYAAPTLKQITNTICDAVDDPATKAHAYTATLKDSFDEIVYYTSTTDVDLAASSRLTLGVFLSNTQQSSKLFHVCGAARVTCTSASLTPIISFGFGRCNAATVTQSDAAAANTIDNAINVPGNNYVTNLNTNNGTTFQVYNISVNEYILVDKVTATSDKPVCFYCNIINSNSGGATLIQFVVSLSIRACDYAVSINTPAGV